MMHFFRPSARQRILRLLAMLALTMCGLTAHAAITCSIAPPSAINLAYVAGTTNNQQGLVTVTCSKTLSTDSASITLTLRTNSGLYPSTNGQDSNVQLGTGGSKILYNLYAVSCTGTKLTGKFGAAAPIAALAMPLQNIFYSTTIPYWACVNKGQANGYTAGTYTDTVTATVTLSSGTNPAPASILVNLFAPAVCTTSNGPGNLTFAYNAFSPTAVFAGTSFAANCTNYLPYTMTLNPVSGVVAGLQYTLGLTLAAAGTASNTGPSTLSAIGNATGSATHYINGSMAAAQPGQTGTPVPQSHTLTITY